MFNFTTQTIYNSLKIATTDQIRAKSVKDYNVILGGTKENPEIRIGNTRFNKENILDIQVKKPTEENLAKVTFDLAKLKSLVTADSKDTFAGSYRIVLYLGLLMNSQDSFYANDLVYKGRPLYVEFNVKSETETPADVAKRIIKIVNKYMLFIAQEKILDVTADSDEITFEGINGYQIIKKAVLQKYDPNANQIDCCNNNGDFVDIITGVPAVWKVTDDKVVVEDKTMDFDGVRDLADNEVAIEPGLEAFGDYNWMIHNLRLPTLANTSFWAVTKSEMPVVGGTYKQYIIRMCKERDNIAGGILGQRATTVTTHVLYVNAADPNLTAFETQLGKLVDSIKHDADDVLEKPFGDTEETTEP